LSEGRKREKLKSGSKRFSKFSLVALSNAAVDVGTFNLFLWLLPTRDPVQLALYNIVAIVLANTNSYVWNTLWTFRERATSSNRQRILFAAQAVFTMGVSAGLFYVLIRPLVIHTDISTYLVGNASKFISEMVGATMSFFIMRYLVFSRKRRFGGRL
jgi:putative flippase GtrA